MIGVPTVVLFGASDPLVWKPLGPRVTVMQKPAMADVTVEEVFNAAQ